MVVPPKCRKPVLTELHIEHPGVTRMKSLARMFVWWPGIDAEIKQLVAACIQCQQQQSMPPGAPLQTWSLPTKPWTRLYLDFVGPFQGTMLLILIDSHSKWIEASLVCKLYCYITVRRFPCLSPARSPAMMAVYPSRLSEVETSLALGSFARLAV